MAYNDFTLEQLNQDFGIAIQSHPDLFANRLQPATLSSTFRDYLDYNAKLALAISTEKARSEMIIAPILVELKRMTGDRISLFSGTQFDVDASQGLTGFCDYLISLSDQQFFIQAPVVVLFEAKNENIKGGLPQCIAAMVAAQIFNRRKANGIETIYGAVTTGNQWKFLQLHQKTACIDANDYYIDRLDQIMGILMQMVTPQGHPLPTP
ncbi:MAG: hypothetical protein IGS38_14545 [Synechococcales cyanobacterium M58_A2018_015]|nr:hypothetical protein [Synechococcales cyanobacterium M58_A2018_015]